MVVLARQKEVCNIKKIRHHLERTLVSYITVDEDYLYFRCLELNAVLCKCNLITRYLVYFYNGNTKINFLCTAGHIVKYKAGRALDLLRGLEKFSFLLNAYQVFPQGKIHQNLKLWLSIPTCKPRTRSQASWHVEKASLLIDIQHFLLNLSQERGLQVRWYQPAKDTHTHTQTHKNTHKNTHTHTHKHTQTRTHARTHTQMCGQYVATVHTMES